MAFVGSETDQRIQFSAGRMQKLLCANQHSSAGPEIIPYLKELQRIWGICEKSHKFLIKIKKYLDKEW